MLIYNHEKKFIGIDETDIKSLKLHSLQDVLNYVDDFADLFVKTPGYVHNFKHIHWIDFLVSGESLDENKVIINLKDKVFRATLNVSRVFLSDSPLKPGYIIYLNNIIPLSQEEVSAISSELASFSAVKQVVDEPDFGFEEEAKSIEDFETDDKEFDLKEPIPSETEEIKLDDFESSNTQDEVSIQEQDDFDDVLKIDDDLFADDMVSDKKDDTSATYTSSETSFDDEDDEFANYHYDPNLASSELGLPVDLVEEFIQDFIAQSNDFKDDLYTALENDRLDSVRTLSHKLKGVAANLRIEDALATLVTINTSEDINEIRKNLDKFYNVIIPKLSGEEPKIAKPTNNEDIIENNDNADLSLNESVDNQDIDVKDDTTDESIEIVNEEDDKIEVDDDLFTINDDESSELKQSSVENVEENIEDDLIEFKDDEDSLDIDIKDDTEADKNQYQEIDIETNASEIGISTQEYKELLEDYKIDALAAIEQLKVSLENQDNDEFKNMSIRLKGMSDNMYLDFISKDIDKLLSNVDNKNEILDQLYNKISNIKS